MFILLLFVSITFINGCTSHQSEPKCYDVQVPYTESRCINELEINLIESDFIDKPVISNEKYECSDRDGWGISNYGNTRLTYEFVNKNDILLSVPCDVIVRNYGQNNEILEEKIVEGIIVNVPAQDTTHLIKEVYLPKCYDFVGIACKDINKLSECQPVTKYRTEQKCD